MGQISGDKSRFNRQRRKKLARRVEMRALRASLGVGAAEQGAAKAAPGKSAAKTSAASE
jgi:hypothetical protein